MGDRGSIAEEFRVAETDAAQRRKSRGDYIVALSPTASARTGVAAWAAVTHLVTFEGRDRDLRVLCKAVVDDSTPNDTARLDQTLRNALGIPFGEREGITVGVGAVRVPFVRRAMDSLAKLLGRRYLVLRVGKGEVGDIEKDMVRVRADAFPLLGCSPASRVVLETVVFDHSKGQWRLSRNSVRAYEWTEELSKRRTAAQEPGFNVRYPHPEKTLGVDPDIGGIYMDAYARRRLGVEPLDCVRVRRDMWNAFLREFREFGIVFFISLFGISQVTPVARMTWAVAGAIMAVALAIAVALTLVKMRALGSD
jgi:hypothetical protein